MRESSASPSSKSQREVQEMSHRIPMRRSLLAVIALIEISQAANTYTIASPNGIDRIAVFALVQLSTGVSIFLLGSSARGMHLPYMTTLILTIGGVILNPRIVWVAAFPHVLVLLVWLESRQRHRRTD